MIKIPYLSLKAMHNELKEEITDAFMRVFSADDYILGSEVEKFEKSFGAYCDTKYAIGCGNGLDAIYLILKALGIGMGDEVIVPSNTYIATALAVSYVGAKPVFVEPDLETFNINPDRIEEAITESTKAVIAVNLYGRMSELDKIKATQEACRNMASYIISSQDYNNKITENDFIDKVATSMKANDKGHLFQKTAASDFFHDSTELALYKRKRGRPKIS